MLISDYYMSSCKIQNFCFTFKSRICFLFTFFSFKLLKIMLSHILGILTAPISGIKRVLGFDNLPIFPNIQVYTCIYKSFCLFNGNLLQFLLTLERIIHGERKHHSFSNSDWLIECLQLNRILPNIITSFIDFTANSNLYINIYTYIHRF